MNPHINYPRDTDGEHQFDPAYPWFSRVRHLFEAIPDGASVVDIGANSGGFGRRLLAEKPHCTVYGVDLARHLLVLATAKGYAGVHCGPAEKLPWSNASFDVAVLSEILEHADDPDACVREAVRVLKPGGMLLGDVPHPWGKWGYRSLKGHKWHRTVFQKAALRALLSAHATDIRICRAPRWPTRHFLLPQWLTFEARKPSVG